MCPWPEQALSHNGKSISVYTSKRPRKNIQQKNFWAWLKLGNSVRYTVICHWSKSCGHISTRRKQRPWGKNNVLQACECSIARKEPPGDNGQGPVSGSLQVLLRGFIFVSGKLLEKTKCEQGQSLCFGKGNFFMCPWLKFTNCLTFALIRLYHSVSYAQRCCTPPLAADNNVPLPLNTLHVFPKHQDIPLDKGTLGQNQEI